MTNKLLYKMKPQKWLASDGQALKTEFCCQGDNCRQIDQFVAENVKLGKMMRPSQE